MTVAKLMVDPPLRDIAQKGTTARHHKEMPASDQFKQQQKQEE